MIIETIDQIVYVDTHTDFLFNIEWFVLIILLLLLFRSVDCITVKLRRQKQGQFNKVKILPMFTK